MYFESKYRNIFEAVPLAMFVVNKSFNIIEANSKFRLLYPTFTEGGTNLCYKTILPFTKKRPCPNCLVERTFQTGKEASRIVKSIRDGSRVFYKLKTSPVMSRSGDIVKVIETIEDITDRIIAEKKFEKYNMEIESERNQKLFDIRDKEVKLTNLISTVHEIKSTESIEESIKKISRGYTNLEAASTAFVLSYGNYMSLAAFSPENILLKLNEIYKRDLSTIEINISKNPGNPFVYTSAVSKPIFYVGDEGIFSFLAACFPGNDPETTLEASVLFKDLSLIIFPLRTKNDVEGTIAVFSGLETLETNFEYYHFLSNSAAVEISRQKNSQMLKNSERKYRNLVENSRDMIILCDAEGNIKFSNRTFYEKTGLKKVQWHPINIYDLLSTKYSLKLKNRIKSCIDKTSRPEPVEVLFDKINGDKKWVEIVMNNSPENDQDVQIIARDITRRKKIETELTKLTAFNNKIVQNDYMGIITMETDGTITSWNKGAKNILKFSENEILGENITELLIFDNEMEGNDFKSRHKNSKYQFKDSIKIKNKDNEPVIVKYMESRMKSGTSKSIAILAFFFDISEKEKLEAISRNLINQAQLITILSLAKLTEYRDIETGSHLERIMKYTESIARELSHNSNFKNYITERYINDLVNSCPLHDIGKVGIPDSILQKPDKLTYDEFEIMKTHTIIGGNTIMEAEKKVKGTSYLNLGKEIAFYHHEKWDGSGYPRGLKGEDIPLSARIVSVADVYDALTSKRPYKEAFSHEFAADYISKEMNSQFDEKIVRAFLACEKEIIYWRNNYS